MKEASGKQEEEKEMKRSKSKNPIGKPNKYNIKYPIPKQRKKPPPSPPVEPPEYKSFVATKPDMLYVAYSKVKAKDDDEVEETSEDREKMAQEKLTAMKYRFKKQETTKGLDLETNLDKIVNEYMERPLNVHVPMNCIQKPKYYLLDSEKRISLPDATTSLPLKDFRKDDIHMSKPECKDDNVRLLAQETLDENEKDMYRTMAEYLFSSDNVKQMPARRRMPRPWKVKESQVEEQDEAASSIAEEEIEPVTADEVALAKT